MAQVVIIGDDLTGSNATGALYARLGLRTVTVGGPDLIPQYAGQVDVLVVNTGSRHWPADAAYAGVRDVMDRVERAGGDVPLIVKRVDTTLRGNPGRELDAVLDGVLDAVAARRPSRSSVRVRALAVPAFPDAGRTTIGGLHLVDGVPLARTAVAHDPFDPVTRSRVTEVLGGQSARSTAELALDIVERGPGAVAAALRACTADVVVCDATENVHLRTLATASAGLFGGGDGPGGDRQGGADRWVVLDSGPFGAALAAEFGLRPRGAAPAPVLAVVGSATDRTREQLARTETALGAVWTDIDPSDPDPVAALDALRSAAAGGATILGVRVAPGPLEPAAAAGILGCLAETAVRAVAELEPGGLYASGGDIATAVTSALGADGFAVRSEVLPLAVAGHLVGGPHDGLLFATKGGLIGGPDAAVACLEHLRAAATRGTSLKHHRQHEHHKHHKQHRTETKG